MRTDNWQRSYNRLKLAISEIDNGLNQIKFTCHVWDLERVEEYMEMLFEFLDKLDELEKKHNDKV